MRLSQWRSSAPEREAVAPTVLGLLQPILRAFVDDADPECWPVWGDDPTIRWTLLVPSSAGLVTCFVRVNVPGEGPRVSAKLVRWSRVQLGELAVETQGEHRLVSFQVEQSVLRGADDAADRVAAFALGLFAAVDGRAWAATPATTATAGRAGRSTGA